MKKKDKLYFGVRGDFDLLADRHSKNDIGAGCIKTEEAESEEQAMEVVLRSQRGL